ncbi:MAG: uridine monophosphate kinase [Lachnospiraceae bacterium]|nr:uridine monophosphate kinase [Lachnospiraceae bacterium]
MAEWNRILLKLSGEALSGEIGHGFDENVCREVAGEIAELTRKGIQIAVVTGGGNFWRGRNSSKIIERSHSDQIGMLGTVINCIYMSELVRLEGIGTTVYTPFECGGITTLFSSDAAVKDLEDGKVIFFAGGTGHPYFSTDSGSSLRALQIGADCIFLAKAVDGIYDSDPNLNPEAKKYDVLPMKEVVEKSLAAIDLTSAVMCLENKMPMMVFGLRGERSIVNAVSGEFTGTRVTV